MYRKQLQVRVFSFWRPWFGWFAMEGLLLHSDAYTLYCILPHRQWWYLQKNHFCIQGNDFNNCLVTLTRVSGYSAVRKWVPILDILQRIGLHGLWIVTKTVVNLASVAFKLLTFLTFFRSCSILSPRGRDACLTS